MADGELRQAAQDAVSRTMQASETLRMRAMQSLASGASVMQRVLPQMPSPMQMAGGMAFDTRMGVGAVQAGVGAGLDFGTLLRPNPYGAPMGFGGALWTAYSGIPGAAQFVSMDPTRARELARGYASTRFEQVVANTWYGAANFASAGLFDFAMRHSGLEVATDRAAMLGRSVLQRQFRGLGRDVLGTDVSAFGQGLDDSGLTRMRERLMRRGGGLSRLQRETLFGSEQLLELADIGGQFAGVGEFQRLGQRGGAGAIVDRLSGGARDVLDITRTLGIDTETLQQYGEAMDRVYSNLDDLKGMAETARRQAIATHQDREVIFQGLASARESARAGFFGMEAGGQTFLGLQQIFQRQIEAGGMSTAEMLRFGGRREASARMAQARMAENMQRIQSGAGNQLLTIASARGGADFLMGGVRSPMAFQQALGGILASDPFAGIRAQMDPQALAMGAAGMDLMMLRQAQQLGTIPGMDPVMVTQRFGQLMGIDIREAATRQRMLMAEQQLTGGARQQSISRIVAGMGASGLTGFDPGQIADRLGSGLATQMGVLQAGLAGGGFDRVTRGNVADVVAHLVSTDPAKLQRALASGPLTGLKVDDSGNFTNFGKAITQAEAVAEIQRGERTRMQRLGTDMRRFPDLANDPEFVSRMSTQFPGLNSVTGAAALSGARFSAVRNQMFSDVFDMFQLRGVSGAKNNFYDSDAELASVSPLGAAVAGAFTGGGQVESFKALIAAAGGAKQTRELFREITGISNFAQGARTAQEFETAFGKLDADRQTRARQLLEMQGLMWIREEMNMMSRRDGSSAQRALWVQTAVKDTSGKKPGEGTDG